MIEDRVSPVLLHAAAGAALAFGLQNPGTLSVKPEAQP